MKEVDNSKGAAEFLQMDRRTLNYLVATNQIPYSRVGKRMLRFRKTRLLEWLAERENIEFRMPRKDSRRKFS